MESVRFVRSTRELSLGNVIEEYTPDLDYLECDYCGAVYLFAKIFPAGFSGKTDPKIAEIEKVGRF